MIRKVSVTSEKSAETRGKVGESGGRSSKRMRRGRRKDGARIVGREERERKKRARFFVLLKFQERRGSGSFPGMLRN